MKARPREWYERLIATVEECLEEGFPWERLAGIDPLKSATAKTEAARRLDLVSTEVYYFLERARIRYGLEPDLNKFTPREPVKMAPTFLLEPLPDGAGLATPDLIEALTSKYQKEKGLQDALKLRKVQIQMDGPIALAFFGDPHLDDPGCAWPDLRRDVEICQRTQGVFAVDVGDDTNNWVGRLQKLYAEQDVTSSQAIQLVEWFMGSLDWLLRIKGNHDEWNTEKGDVADYIQRLLGQMGALAGSGQRMQLMLPNGADVFMHVRHDFPGASQFNPAHGMVRETLWNFRDHILACGHRHNTGYIPVWHNDPARLCHAFRCGTYKDFDKYAKEKGFKESNWGRALGATIEPEFADQPSRFIKPWYDLEDMAEFLNWRRQRFELGYSASV